MKHLGRTAFAEKNEMQHLSLPASAVHRLQQYCISIVQASIFTNARYDFGGAAGGFWGEKAKVVLSSWNAALSLYSKFLMEKACLLSAHPRHFPEERALLLEASHAILDPHHMSQRGPIIQG